MKAQQESQARIERRRTVRRELTVEEESPEDIRQRNRREAEILAGNLGEGGVTAGEILSDMSLLKQLAQLQESMVGAVFRNYYNVIIYYNLTCQIGMVFR